jgi:hypothetical protein
MVLPLGWTLIQEAVGVPTVMVGLVGEAVLSLPTTCTVWAAGLEPLTAEKVTSEGSPMSTGACVAVTSRFTATLEVPAEVVIVMVAV